MNIYSAISANKRKTWLIMFLFVVFLTTVVYVFTRAMGYDISITLIALVFATATSFGSFYYSDKIVLSSVNAKSVKKEDFPELYRVVENLSIGSGMPMPALYVINDPAPNAFATGRDPKHAVICVTTGLMQTLSRAELEGVISHEMSHVKNLDIRLMAIVAVLVGFVVIIADLFTRHMLFRRSDERNNAQLIFLVIGIIFAILSPLAATLIQLAISRKREYLADASGALLTRYPAGLASALEKISSYPRPLRSANNATAHLFISNPFKAGQTKKTFSSLFNTHPPIEERVKILRSM